MTPWGREGAEGQRATRPPAGQRRLLLGREGAEEAGGGRRDLQRGGGAHRFHIDAEEARPPLQPPEELRTFPWVLRNLVA